jgi:SNF2 family DNA or RNA helicase
MKLIFTRRLAELMDKQQFQGQNLEESMAALGITMQIRTFRPLHKPTQLQPHQIIAVNWMTEKENSLAKGGLLADDYRTGKVRPHCALEIFCSPH